MTNGRKKIPYGRQWLDREDISSVVSVLKSDFLTQGSRIEEFEKAIASYVDAKYAVALNNGTSALPGACFAAGIRKGDEVITTPYTFAASANCIVWFGAKPVFADVGENSFNIDPLKIEGLITKKTKAIIVVDFAGLPCDFDSILKIAKKHKLFVIEDAAQSLGASYKGKMIGSFCDGVSFSFHPVKTITTGEGGLVTTNNLEVFEKLKVFRNHGIVKGAEMFSGNEGGWFYEMIELGLNLRITDFQAALGTSQLKRIEKFLRRRRQIAALYNKSFSDLCVLLPDEPKSVKSAWHLYPIRLNLNDLDVGRRQIFDELHKRGLGVQVHFIPVHLHPFYRKKYGFIKGDFPCAEKAYEEEISLPIFPKMTDSEVRRVIKVFREVILKHTKKIHKNLGKFDRKSLVSEFLKIKKENNPKVKSDIDAVVVLSGESADIDLRTDLHDTEKRLEFGISLVGKIKKLGGNPTLVLDGTPSQNQFMNKIVKGSKIGKKILVKNPKVPFASTITQLRGIKNLKFKKIAIVTHAYHALRAKIAAAEILSRSVNFEFFLIDRKKLGKDSVDIELGKIKRYIR